MGAPKQAKLCVCNATRLCRVTTNEWLHRSVGPVLSVSLCLQGARSLDKPKEKTKKLPRVVVPRAPLAKHNVHKQQQERRGNRGVGWRELRLSSSDGPQQKTPEWETRAHPMRCANSTAKVQKLGCQKRAGSKKAAGGFQ